MDLGGWRTRSVLARYNVTSERDLADALERVTRYVAERSAETPKVEPLRAEPAQNPRNRPSSEGRRAKRAAASARNPEWRRAESNRGPRDYETPPGRHPVTQGQKRPEVRRVPSWRVTPKAPDCLGVPPQKRLIPFNVPTRAPSRSRTSCS